MPDQELSERTIQLIIVKAFDELSNEEDNELSEIIKRNENGVLIQSLMQDKDKLIEFVCEYTQRNVECDDKKLEAAKKAFDLKISKMKVN